MNLGFKQPNPNGYMPLVLAMAQRDRAQPVSGEFDPQDPASVRSAYEQDYSGPANGATGGYFDMLMFLANVEGRLRYKPKALTNEESFEKIVDTYWAARCQHGIVSATTLAEAPSEPSEAVLSPAC